MGLTLTAGIVLVVEACHDIGTVSCNLQDGADMSLSDCVMAYNLQAGDARRVLVWDRGQDDQFGGITSLCIHDNDLLVAGEKGLLLYKLTNM